MARVEFNSDSVSFEVKADHSVLFMRECLLKLTQGSTRSMSKIGEERAFISSA